MEPVVNGACLLNSNGVNPDRCAALGILEQNKCFLEKLESQVIFRPDRSATV